MSLAKSFYHEEICAQMGDFNDYEEMMIEDETELDMFSDRRISFDGY